VLHREEVRAARLLDVEDLADARVRDAPREEQLALEALDDAGLCGEAFVKDLHAHVDAEQRVARAEDRPGGSLAELLEQLVSAQLVSDARQGGSLRSARGRPGRVYVQQDERRALSRPALHVSRRAAGEAKARRRAHSRTPTARCACTGAGTRR